MKHHTNAGNIRCGLAVVLLAGTVGVAGANTLVTFQVDMSNAGIDPNTQTVSARGTFNNWGNAPGVSFYLTNNPTGADPYLYSGTTNVPLNGTVMAYKYVAANWESIAKGNNRLVTLPSTSGASLILPVAVFGDSDSAPLSVDLTFKVDLAQQISLGTFVPGVSIVYPKGTFNGWGTYDTMTNDPTILRTNQYGLVTSNVYVGTYTITASHGQTMDYKFYIDTGGRYENPAPGTGDPSDHNNRFLNIENTPTQMLPIVFFSDVPYVPVATNLVTFQVDMSAQVLNGSFDPGSGTVEVRGDFNNWGNQLVLCTNNPTALSSNIYRAVVSFVGGAGATEYYKYYASVALNGGWETMGDNRNFKLVSGPAQTLPVVYFNNLNPGDLLPEDTLVTFTINMTNAVGTDSHAFDPASDQVFLNGVPNGFGTWDGLLPQLTNHPVGTKLYSIELLIPKGSPVQQTYKYGINAGNDNEAASGVNHVRFLRQTGMYALPPDTFGDQHVEPSFGQLAVGAPASSYVPVSWLGRPGVHVQTSASLPGGAWTDLLNTDGAAWKSGTMSSDGFVSVTNYPTSGAATFFRLIKP